MRRMWIIVGVAAAVMAALAGAAGASARATPLGRGIAVTAAGRPNIGAFDINDHGEIVGTYWFGSFGNVSHGFVLRHGVFTTLNAPGSAHLTEAKGVNDAGVIAGGYFDIGGHRHGFVLSHGRYHAFNDPHGAGGTHSHGINAAADIVGTYEDASGITHGFLRHDGRYTTINVP